MIWIFYGSLPKHICIVSLNDHTIYAFDPAIHIKHAFAYAQRRLRYHKLLVDLIEAEREEFAVGRPFYRSRRECDALEEGTKAQRAMRILSTEGHASSFVSYIIRDLQVRARLSSHG